MPGTTPKRMRVVSLAAVSSVLLAYSMSPKTAAKGLFKKPSVVLRPSKMLIMIPCPPGMLPFSGVCPADGLQVSLTSLSDGFRNPNFVYKVGAGRIVGEGDSVIWDLSGVLPGNYTATVEVHDSKKHRAVSSVTIKVQECRDCVSDHTCFCPLLAVICYDEVKAGTPITCKVVMQQRECATQFVWSALDSTDQDLLERLTARDNYLSIATQGLAGRTVYATVEVKGLDPSCNRTASSQTKVKP